MIHNNYYNYHELREKAIAPNASQEEIAALVNWLDDYSVDSWKGERYEIEGFEIFPIYQELENGDFEVTGYEVR